jgi:hypothetical protein
MFLLLGVANAQVQITATAAQAAVRAGSTVALVPPPGSAVGNGVFATASSGVGSAQWTASHTVGATGCTSLWSVTGTAAQSGTAVGEGRVRYTWSTPTVVAATLSIDWSASQSGTGAAVCSVDLNGDGSVDGNGSGVFAVQLGPVPLVVDVHASATASAGSLPMGWGSSLHYSGSATGLLSLQLVPSGTAVTVVQPACGVAPPWLEVAAEFAPGLRCSGMLASPAELGLLVLGLQPSSLPLPWATGCSLAVAPDVVWWQPRGSVGEVAWQLPVPHAVRPVSLHARLLALELGPWRLAGSPALRVDVQ